MNNQTKATAIVKEIWPFIMNELAPLFSRSKSFMQSPLVEHDLNFHTDVTAGSPDDGDVLTWDAGDEQWINAPPAAGSGGTLANFAPALSYVVSGVVTAVHSWANLAVDVQTFAYTSMFKIPSAGSVTVNAVIQGFASDSGNVRLDLRVYRHKTDGSAVSASGTGYAAIALTTATDRNYRSVVSVNFTATAGEICYALLDRTGAHADDTYENDIGFLGVEIS